jgi:hypothetical protein
MSQCTPSITIIKKKKEKGRRMYHDHFAYVSGEEMDG